MSALLATASKRIAPAALGDHAGHLVAHRLDLGHRIVHAHRAADPLEMRDHARDQLVGAALGEPDAAVLFQLVDQRVDRAGLHRVAADEQGVEAQCLAQFLVLHERRHDRIDRAPRLIFHQRRRSLDHAGKVEKRLVAELEIALVMHACAVCQELFIARDIFRVQLLDLGAKARLVVRIIEVGAIGPVEPVERHHRHQLDIFADVMAGQRPQFFQARRIGDDGRAGVEGKAVLFPEIGAAARLVAAFDDGGGNSGRLQTDGKRQPAESRPDNSSFLHVRFGPWLRPECAGRLCSTIALRSRCASRCADFWAKRGPGQRLSALPASPCRYGLLPTARLRVRPDQDNDRAMLLIAARCSAVSQAAVRPAVRARAARLAPTSSRKSSASWMIAGTSSGEGPLAGASQNWA